MITPRPQPGVSVVIPVYNSELTLQPLFSRLSSVLSKEQLAFEVIFVDDGSADRSWDVISEIASSHPAARGFRMMRNYGQHNALLCGIRNARFAVVATMDDDLQNPPEEVPKLLQKLEEGFDVVYGVPQKEQHGLWRDLASQVAKIALQSAMGAETARNVSAFRVFRTELRDAFAVYRGAFVSIDVLLTWGTRRFGSVRVRHAPRAAGTSNYTFRKLVAHAMNMMTGFSTVPLQLASVAGFLFTAFGMAVLVYVVVRHLMNPGVAPGFAFLASAIAIFSGAQLFALGILGEYIARIHLRTMDRPAYAVKLQTDTREEEAEREHL